MRMKKMARSNAEILRENATAGFEAFEEKMLKNTKESIFNNAYEINARNEIHGYLCDCATEYLDEEEIKVLIELGDTVVDALYDYFSEAENVSIMYYSDITEWVEDFCQGVLKGEI